MKHFSIVSLSACALVIAVPFINPVTGIALISQSTSALAQSNNQNQPLELKLSAKKQVISQDKQGKQIKTWESLQSNTVSPGDILQYTLTGINNGNKPIANVTLNPLIPKQMVYVVRDTVKLYCERLITMLRLQEQIKYSMSEVITDEDYSDHKSVLRKRVNRIPISLGDLVLPVSSL